MEQYQGKEEVDRVSDGKTQQRKDWSIIERYSSQGKKREMEKNRRQIKYGAPTVLQKDLIHKRNSTLAR